MRVQVEKKGIPEFFCRHPVGKGIIAEADIGITPRARVFAKLLVFESRKALRRFWEDAMNFKLGRGCLGAVSGLGYTKIKFLPGGKEKHSLVCDPRYFCLIGLVKGYLTMEIIAHEATHVGYRYAERMKSRPWCCPGDLPEEAVCYPAGRAAATIDRFLRTKGLY